MKEGMGGMFKKFIIGFTRIFCMLAVFTIIAYAIMGFKLFIAKNVLGIMYKIALISAIVLLTYFLYRVSNKKCQWFWMVLICIGIVIRLVYAVSVRAPIYNDQLVCLNAAQHSVRGDFSWANLEYFQVVAYQIPFVLYEAVILKIFGTVRALYIFNGIFSILTCLMIYLIVKKLYDKNTALMITAIFSCFPEQISRVSFLYNYIISGFFFLVAIYFFVTICRDCDKDENNFRRNLYLSLLTGLFFGISNLFRKEAVVGFLGAECWFIYYFISRCRRENMRFLLLHTLSYMIVIYAVYKAVNLVVDFSIIHTGISPNGIKNRCPYWIVVCGLTPDNYGIYSTKYIYIQGIRDKNEQFVAFKSIMHDIFDTQNFKSILSFFFNKGYYMWGEAYYLNKFYKYMGISKILRATLIVFDHFAYTLVFLLSAVGLKKKQYNNFVAFISIVIIGFFLAYVIKEIHIQYRYFTFLTAVILSASGVDYLRKRKNKL